MTQDTITYDPVTGERVSLIMDAAGNQMVLSEADVTLSQKYAREMEAQYRPGAMIGDTQRHMQPVAEIPPMIYFDLLNKFGHPHQDPKAWQRWLSDNKDFLLWSGSL